VVVAEDLWVYDVAGRPPIKLTSDGGHYSPLWTPDGQRLVYEAAGPGPTLVALPADGSTGKPQAVSPVGHFHPAGWSGDGEELVAVRVATPGGTREDIVRWSLAKPDVVQPVVETPAAEGVRGATLSPDRRWLAYASDQTGQQEIWVRPYPGPGAAVRISPNGGEEAVWARSGRELYYLEGTRLMAVAVTAGDRFNFSPATLLFDNNYLLSPQPPSYDVAWDGRFLMIKPIGGDTEVAPSQIVVIQNWFEELKRLVPTN
jgi:dipeptidyl aminopeptidase/acylaminoacyl peptidase